MGPLRYPLVRVCLGYKLSHLDLFALSGQEESKYNFVFGSCPPNHMEDAIINKKGTGIDTNLLCFINTRYLMITRVKLGKVQGRIHLLYTDMTGTGVTYFGGHGKWRFNCFMYTHTSCSNVLFPPRAFAGGGLEDSRTTLARPLSVLLLLYSARKAHCDDNDCLPWNGMAHCVEV